MSKRTLEQQQMPGFSLAPEWWEPVQQRLTAYGWFNVGWCKPINKQHDDILQGVTGVAVYCRCQSSAGGHVITDSLSFRLNDPERSVSVEDVDAAEAEFQQRVAQSSAWAGGARLSALRFDEALTGNGFSCPHLEIVSRELWPVIHTLREQVEEGALSGVNPGPVGTSPRAVTEKALHLASELATRLHYMQTFAHEFQGVAK